MTPRASLINVFARHPTASNLLMMLMVIGGLLALMRINTQFFPDFGIDVISISIEWPGASAEDVDANIVQAVEPEVRFLDGVKTVRSISREGSASIIVEFQPGSDMQTALNNVETGVGQVRTLPEDSERPEIRRVVRYDTITRIVLTGPFSELTLKKIAKRMRNDLLDRGIDKVDIIGGRDEEIWVEVAPTTLMELDLTLEDIAQRIRETSQDIPSGTTAGAVERQIRSLGLRRDAAGVETVEIRALEGGEKILLRDIATVRDTFERGSTTLRRLGDPAMEIHVRRAVNADALELADITRDYLAEIRASLPEQLVVEEYGSSADLIYDRIDLLLRNGLGGLILVVVILFLFLNARVALWVAVGIPVSMLATLVLMLATGQSINMISLFGMIMALGIIVDDAIVVGEHAETQSRRGLSPLDAAITGAQRMMVPVLCASLTTIAAFSPLLLIGDIIGQIISAIPITIITVIVASLIECFLILPGHLRSALGHGAVTAGRFRTWFDNGFARFRDGFFRHLLVGCIRWRYLTTAAAVASLVVSAGLVIGGRIDFVFFPAPESDTIYANLRMVAGTPREQTRDALDRIEDALDAAEVELAGGLNEVIKMRLVRQGDAVGETPGINESQGDHIGGIVVELIPSDQRDIRTRAVIAAWRQHLRPFPGVETLTIRPGTAGPPGRDLDLRVLGPEIDTLKQAATEVQALLARYPGVSEIEDNLPFGKREIILEVTPRGRALGFSTEEVGRQVRHAFEGAIARRFAREDEEITIRVQYDRDAAGVGVLETMDLRAPSGGEVALDDVVSTEDKLGFETIRREDGSRQVSISAEIDSRVVTPTEVEEALWQEGLAAIGQRHGVRFRFAGKAEERENTFADMKVGSVVALIAIYIILAWVFASYTRPLVVMSVIPLAFVGASIGHYLLGFDLTILSMVALLGLSGIVVNDSIILVSTIQEQIDDGKRWADAIVDGTCARLRAVILTSATTIGGLTPLIFERSLQAQFLVPMAVTIVFGLLGTTFLVLLVVPALLAIQEDLAGLRSRLLRRSAPPPAIDPHHDPAS